MPKEKIVHRGPITKPGSDEVAGVEDFLTLLQAEKSRLETSRAAAAGPAVRSKEPAVRSKALKGTRIAARAAVKAQGGKSGKAKGSGPYTEFGKLLIGKESTISAANRKLILETSQAALVTQIHAGRKNIPTKKQLTVLVMYRENAVQLATRVFDHGHNAFLKALGKHDPPGGQQLHRTANSQTDG